ncbi:hypothetical protein HYDPIDRAFT_116936 [Hydnomerulius pinastri MD-312]|uniref:Cytochrome P450 n=1 Tax=Hydnomerulius pinastri MD-312 TaxID=994086 RepID=A0A0C9V528_9AGAM|nr:hypothetical protein HYDPIDRAFT_116936 [Hydnomerulius pinastri MD-312]
MPAPTFSLNGTDALVLVLSSSLIGCWWLDRHWHSRERRALPPGPPGKFGGLLGNLGEMAGFEPWKRLAKWGQVYGSDLVYLRSFGTGVLVINSSSAVTELFEKQSSFYSDRPTFTMAGELIGLDQGLGFAHYGPHWRMMRKLAQRALGTEAIKKYHGVQEDVIALFLHSLVEQPDEFAKALHLASGRIIQSVTYGFAVNTPSELYLHDMEKTMEMVTEYVRPGAFLVDIFPFLKHLPAWFPFNTIHKTAAAGRELLLRSSDRPFGHVKQLVKEGRAPPSYVADGLAGIYEGEQKGPEGERGVDVEYCVKWSANTMYGAGSETTYGTVIEALYLLALHPEIQARAYAEIEAALGSSTSDQFTVLERLPSIADRPALPYVNALVKEVYRYNPVVPMGLPRRSEKDGWLGGKFIPKDTLIIPNVWALSRDRVSGIPPEQFEPARFLEDHLPRPAVDPLTYTFGFGRRICPGRFLGDNSVFLFISGLIATFEISMPEGTDISFVPGLVSYPQPFKVNLVPRSEQIITAVKTAAMV